MTSKKNTTSQEVNVNKVKKVNQNVNKIEDMKNSNKQYHFVEVMTCPGGCIGGGGQPKNLNKDMHEVRKARIAALYKKDETMTLRKSHENPEIKKVYEEFYGKPLSEMSLRMLHTEYNDKSKELGKQGSN